MLPFHKRPRANSSIEIGTDELEAIELPHVKPPSVRPAAFAAKRPAIGFSSFADDEMTIVRPDKRTSSFPPAPPSSRRADFSQRIPYSPPPRFERSLDDEPTMLHPGSSSRPLLAMSSPRMMAHEVPPPPSSRSVMGAPRSSTAVDPSASSSAIRAVDLSMTASVTGSHDVRRPTMGWAASLVAVGVFAGLVVAFVSRGDGLATAAAFIDPSQHAVTADVVKVAGAQAQAPIAQVAMPGAVAVQAQPAQPQVVTQKPVAPSCNADAPIAKIVERVVEPKVEAPTHVVAATTYIAPKPVVHQAAIAQVAQPQVREPAAPVAISKPAVKVGRRASGDDMDSANAADALAKAQLEAALSR